MSELKVTAESVPWLVEGDDVLPLPCYCPTVLLLNRRELTSALHAGMSVWIYQTQAADFVANGTLRFSVRGTGRPPRTLYEAPHVVQRDRCVLVGELLDADGSWRFDQAGDGQ